MVLKICVEKTNLPEQLNLNNSLRAVFLKNFLWENFSDIKIIFLEDPINIKKTSLYNFVNKNIDPLEIEIRKLNLSVKEAIKKIILERIQPIVNLNFKFIENQNQIDNNTIRIGFSPYEGCWSYVGNDIKNIPHSLKTMNFGWFDVATVIHEFGHALGMVHEHQNPRGEQIDWNEEKVYDWARKTQGWSREQTYQNIIQKYTEEETNGSGFDNSSIMLYFFPPELTLNNEGTTQNLRLSFKDIKWINSNYIKQPNINLEKFYDSIQKTILTEEDIDQLQGYDTFKKNLFGFIFLIIIFLIIIFFVFYKKK